MACEGQFEATPIDLKVGKMQEEERLKKDKAESWWRMHFPFSFRGEKW